MSDLISRQAAIDALDTIHYTDREDWWAVLSTVENLPTVQPEADRIYSIMKDYYFEHKDDHDQSWQSGFAKCMNLIPNVWERREER